MKAYNVVMTRLGSKERVIFHMDGDAFFVGVEVAKNPKLRGLPVVTGEERGIVSALSYEAKALGIVDDLGDVYDAAKLALTSAGITLKDDELPTLHYANGKKNILEKALEASSSITGVFKPLTTGPSIELRAF